MRALICYISVIDANIDTVNHAAYMRFNQMIHYFVSRGFCVNTCHCPVGSTFEWLKSNNNKAIGFALDSSIIKFPATLLRI